MILITTKEKEEKINEGDPLWLKEKKDIKEEDYKQFYNNISFNFDEPLKTIHYNAEGVINYKSTCCTFQRTNQWIYLTQREKIKSNCTFKKFLSQMNVMKLCQIGLRFVPGVVDSQDISSQHQ